MWYGFFLLSPDFAICRRMTRNTKLRTHLPTCNNQLNSISTTDHKSSTLTRGSVVPNGMAKQVNITASNKKTFLTQHYTAHLGDRRMVRYEQIAHSWSFRNQEAILSLQRVKDFPPCQSAYQGDSFQTRSPHVFSHHICLILRPVVSSVSAVNLCFVLSLFLFLGQ